MTEAAKTQYTGSSHAGEFGHCPLADRDQALFTVFVAGYAKIIQLSVEEAIARIDRNVFPQLKALARRAGENDAVPQDLIAVHLSALAGLIHEKPHIMARTCIRHSRLLLVKLIGELALFYRDRSVRPVVKA